MKHLEVSGVPALYIDARFLKVKGRCEHNCEPQICSVVWEMNFVYLFNGKTRLKETTCTGVLIIH